MKHQRAWSYLTVAVLAWASFFTALRNDYAYDDRWVILHNPRVHTLSWQALLALWHETYWPPYMLMTLFRPVTMSAFTFEWAFGRGAPFAFHLTSVLLFIAICLLVLRLARALLPPMAAWTAAALFVVHPVHVEAVANMVGQSELIVALCAVAATLLYLRWRTDASSVWWAITVCVLCGLAAAAKENGVLVPLLLLAAECTIVRDTRPFRERVRVLRPLVLALVATELGYLYFRFRVLGMRPGDLPAVEFQHMNTAGRLWTMVGVIPQWVRLLFWPARLVADYAPRDLTLYTHFSPSLLLGFALVAAVAVVLAVSWRRAPVIAFGVLWVLIGLLPVSNLLVPTGVILAERTMMLPSVGAMLIVGAVSAMLLARWRAFVEKAGQRWQTRQVLAGGVLAVLLMLGLVRSATRSLTWRNSDTVFAQEVIDAPFSYRAHYSYAGSLFEHNDLAGGEREAQIALALYPDDNRLPRDLAVQYMKAGLYQPAIPLLHVALETALAPTDARVLLADCLMMTGDTAGARREALAAAGQGQYAPNAHRVFIGVVQRRGHQ